MTDRSPAGRVEQVRDWPAAVSDGLSLACSDCGETPPFDYRVSEEFWTRWVADDARRGVVCLPCLDRRCGGEGLAGALEEVQWTGTGHTVVLHPTARYEYQTARPDFLPALEALLARRPEVAAAEPDTESGRSLWRAGMMDTPPGVWRVSDGRAEVVAKSIRDIENEAARGALEEVRTQLLARIEWHRSAHPRYASISDAEVQDVIAALESQLLNEWGPAITLTREQVERVLGALHEPEANQT